VDQKHAVLCNVDYTACRDCLQAMSLTLPVSSSLRHHIAWHSWATDITAIQFTKEQHCSDAG